MTTTKTTTAAASVLGVGVVSPAGCTVDDLWRVVEAGQKTIADAATIPELPDRRVLLCRASGFDPAQRLERHELRRLDRSHQMAICAADDALTEAGESPGADRCAVVVGIGFGAAEFYEQQARALTERGAHAVSPLAIPVIMPNSIAATLSLRYGFRGPSLTVSAACASGAAAIGEALWLLRTGRADRVLAGGVDALHTPHVIVPFARMEAMSARVDAPDRSSSPFDSARDGFVLGEGAGFVVLERSESAAGRRGHVIGYATNSDAHHLVAPPDGGITAAECMRLAVADAGIATDDVGHVNAHGTSTVRNDLAEARAIHAVFGRTIPVTATKSVIGHLIGGAGAVEAIVALESAARGVIPGTANLDRIDPDIEGLVDVVTSPRAVGDAPVLSNSFGFGGHNSCLMVTR